MACIIDTLHVGRILSCRYDPRRLFLLNFLMFLARSDRGFRNTIITIYCLYLFLLIGTSFLRDIFFIGYLIDN